MILGLAQAPSGDNLQQNIAIHKQLISAAAKMGIEVLLFPELSLTGYSPSNMSKILGSDLHQAVDELRAFSQNLDKEVLVGMPYWRNSSAKPVISRQLLGSKDFRHEKSLIHPDEEPFFSIGMANSALHLNQLIFNVGICFESCQSSYWQSIPAADFLLCPVAKDQPGMAKSKHFWTEIAKEQQRAMLICNASGSLEGFEASGGSMLIDQYGKVIYEAEKEPALISFDLKALVHKETRLFLQ